MIELDDLTIRTLSVGDMDNNVYLLTAKRSGRQVIIDAADDAPAIFSLMSSARVDAEQPTRLAYIVTTHSHWDHVRALAEVAQKTGAATAAGREDVAEIEVPTTTALDAGRLEVADDLHLEVIKLRGHTAGSVALLYRSTDGPAHLFTGDSLFPGGVGNTFGDPERFATLIDDVTERVFDCLLDDTFVHPGHGQGTTLGAERSQLDIWRARGW